jgi:hypothetical protein
VRTQPAVATWLLTRIAPSTPESVIGDLQEEFETGRSTGWYYRQVLRAIGTATFRQATGNTLLTVRALFVGWICFWIFLTYVYLDYVVGFCVSPDEWLFVRGVADIRSWWPNIPAQLTYTIASLTFGGVGWIVGRFHAREAVLIFAVTVFANNLSWVMQGFKHGWWHEGSLTSMFIALAVIPVSILVGGVAPHQKDHTIRAQSKAL